MQTFSGLRYLSRFLDWTQSRWDKAKFTMKAFPTFERGCREKHLLLADVNVPHAGSSGSLWQTLSSPALKSSGPFFTKKKKKKTVGTKSNYMVEMEKQMTGLVLAPGSPAPESRVFSWTPQAGVDSPWVLGTARAAGDTATGTGFEFLTFGKSGSMTRRHLSQSSHGCENGLWVTLLIWKGLK